MRVIVFPLLGFSVLGSPIPTDLVGTYTYVSSSDMYMMQLRMYANATADFEFLLNNGCNRNIEFPQLWSVKGMDVAYNDTENQLVFFPDAEKAEQQFPQLAEMRTAFAPLGELVIPITVPIRPGNTLSVKIIKLITEVPKVPDQAALDMQSVMDELVLKKNAKNVGVQPSNGNRPVGAASKSSESTMIVAAVILSPIAAGMFDWLLYA